MGEFRAVIAVLDNPSSPSKPSAVWNAWVGDAGEQLNMLLEKRAPTTKEPVKVPIARKPKRKKRGYVLVEKSLAEIKKLPLVDGPITWDVAQKMAKKLGVKNLTQLRSDLFKRQKLG
jgi:hypothetical protein